MWIRYGGGTHGSLPRKIFPLKFINVNQFLAVCHLDNPPKTKTFNVDKVTEVRDHEWMPESEEMEVGVQPSFMY